MRRRDFIKAIVGAVTAWPLVARAQQTEMAVIGFLGSATPQSYEMRLGAFRQGLKEIGYVEGQNVEIDYRWAEGQNNRLPILAAQLVQRRVAVLVAGGGTPTAMAAKGATATIPVDFAIAADPVAVGLVASLDKPGGNLTGVTNMNEEIGPKRLELLHELLPLVTLVAVFVNPANPVLAGPFVRDLQGAADRLGLQLHVLNANTERDIDTAFADLVQLRAGALVVMPDVFFNSHVVQIAALAISHKVPTIYQYRPFVEAGGLISYGSDELEYYRWVGIQAGKILKGEKPAELPVVRSTKVELIINLKTAKALGITIPLPLQGRADNMIE
ncbi:MAG: ABC transporter substrate-binding protein [Xanthobacteraceae bacterium]